MGKDFFLISFSEDPDLRLDYFITDIAPTTLTEVWRIIEVILNSVISPEKEDISP